MQCDLTQLTEAERKRLDLLVEWLQVGIEDIIECSDGFEFLLDPRCAISRHVTEFVEMERRCCPFLDFRIGDDPSHSGPKVRVGGSGDAKVFVASHFGIRR